MLLYYALTTAPIPILNIPNPPFNTQECPTSSSIPEIQAPRPPHQRQRKGALLPRHSSPQANPKRRARWQIKDTAARKGRLQGARGTHISLRNYGQVWWKDILSRKYNECPE